MVIPLKFGKLSIGRSDAPTPNDFELDGMGICERHCLLQGATETSVSPPTGGGGAAASAEGGGGGGGGGEGLATGTGDGNGSSGAVTTVGASVTLLDDTADLHVNGEALHGLEARRALEHMDRLIIGPCRVVCLYLTEKLTPMQKAQYTYDSAFREFMSGNDNAARLLMSPRRQALLEEVQRIEGLMLKEANIIAHDLCTNIEFVSQLLLGADGLGSSGASLDDLFQRNECRVKVVCHASAKRISTSADLLAARRAKMEAEKVLKAAKSKKQLLRKQSPGGTVGGAPGEHARGESAQVEESSGGGGEDKAAALLRADSLGALPVHEDGDDEDEAKSPREQADAEAAAAPAKVLAENILFEMEADNFADLLSELKATHHGLSQLLGGVQSAGKGVESGTASMIKSVFDAVDTDRSGFIDK
jgi:hypothetical protein